MDFFKLHSFSFASFFTGSIAARGFKARAFRGNSSVSDWCEAAAFYVHACYSFQMKKKGEILLQNRGGSLETIPLGALGLSACCYDAR